MRHPDKPRRHVGPKLYEAADGAAADLDFDPLPFRNAERLGRLGIEEDLRFRMQAPQFRHVPVSRFFDNPASMSLHEEATGAALRPMMGVFNNLVMYRQDVAQNSPDSIISDLATSWSWSEDSKELTFPLRHDGGDLADEIPF
jgi:ABC-type transport system substrate-binding protein